MKRWCLLAMLLMIAACAGCGDDGDGDSQSDAGADCPGTFSCLCGDPVCDNSQWTCSPCNDAGADDAGADDAGDTCQGSFSCFCGDPVCDNGQWTCPDCTADGGCSLGPVSFELAVVNGDPGAYCTNFCENWLGFRNTAGEGFALGHVMDCTPNCSDCTPVPCPGAACGYTAIPPEGLAASWAGAYQLDGTCGENVSCRETACAPAGPYIAVMCVYSGIGGPTDPCSLVEQKTICVQRPFDLPGSSGQVVRAEIDASK